MPKSDSRKELDDAGPILREGVDYATIEMRVLGWLATHPDFDIRLLQGEGLSTSEQDFLRRSLLALSKEEAFGDCLARGWDARGKGGMATRTITVEGRSGTVTGRVSHYYPEPHRFSVSPRRGGPGV